MTAQTFRSAFNGFNREDVIHHLEYVNNKHANEINQLKQENEALQAEIALLRSRPIVSPAVSAEKEALEAENAALQQQIEALQAQLDNAQAEAQVNPPVCPAAAAPTDQELEIYRRAERVEREARERAAQICHQANGALADAVARVDEAAVRIDEMANKVAGQLGQLQDLVTGSKLVLREAANAISSVQPTE